MGIKIQCLSPAQHRLFLTAFKEVNAGQPNTFFLISAT